MTSSDSVNNLHENLKFKYNDLESLEAALQKTADNFSLLVSSDDELLNRYNENMAAFANFHPEIYSFFKSYEPKKYVVDTTHGFINALNVEDGSYFYSYPSYLMTKLQFEDFQENPPIKKFHFFSKNKRNEADFIHVDFLNKLSNIYEERAKSGNTHQKSLRKDLSSIVLFGLGAGYHLEMLATQHNTSCIFIVEPDLDLFFLSLFAINWKCVLELLERKGARLHISLGEQTDTFFDEFILFSANNGRYQLSNVAGYLHYHSKALGDILDVFNKRYLEFGRGFGFFDDAVMSIGHTLSNLKSEIGLLKKDLAVNKTIAHTPVFILGNGPSLDNIIPYIKKYRDKAIVISCGTTISSLAKYGIKPDIHCEQERTSPVKDSITYACSKEFLDKVLFIAPATVHPSVFGLFSDSIMALKGDEAGSELVLEDSEYKKLFESYQFINPTVANAALTIAYGLGFKEFYFMGVDLGQKSGGAHHSKNSLYYGDDKNDQHLYALNENESVITLGNFGGEFICDRFFHESNENLARKIAKSEDITCFNVSDGALIKGTKPLKKELLDNVFVDKDLINFLEVKPLLLEACTFIDKDKQLHSRLISKLEFDVVADLCTELRTTINRPIESISDAADILLLQTDILRKKSKKIHDLFIGSLLHFQVCLSNFLYDGANRRESLREFKEGVKIYDEFLLLAPSYYRDNACKEHVIDNSWWSNRLEKLKT